MIKRTLTLAAILLFVAGGVASAQEMTTDAERNWKVLRNSDDVKTKLMADRWYGLVKQQEWSDTSGKFKTSAKYVAHDPALAWIKLRVIQGAGDKRVVKDVQIPLEKLSVSCQWRVRQIARLSEKITQALEDEKKRVEEKEKDDASGGKMKGPPRGTRREREGVLAGTDAEQVTTEREPARERRGRRPPPSASGPITNDRPPLPAMLPPLPSRGGPATVSEQTPAAETVAPKEAEQSSERR